MIIDFEVAQVELNKFKEAYQYPTDEQAKNGILLLLREAFDKRLDKINTCPNCSRRFIPIYKGQQCCCRECAVEYKKKTEGKGLFDDEQ